MPFEIPTLQGLAERTRGAFRTNLKGSDAWLWPNNVAVSAKVIAGAVWESFSFLDYISRQIFAATADTPFLERHAAEYGMARLPATYATGQITLTGDASVPVPAGLVVQRADGVRYDITAGGITSGLGSVTLPVRAQAAGRAGNTVAGAGVALIAPLARINSDGVVAASGIGAGADVESDASLRARVLFRKRNPPHGGAAHDYVLWAREINGVTRVFVDPVTSTNGRTSVGVWILMDGSYTNGIPLAADVTAVRDYIDSVRPAGALVEVGAPSAVAVAITITGLSPDTAAIREAIAAELADLIAEARVSTLTSPYTLYRSQIIEAVSIATGEDHHTLTAPASDVALTAGQIPVLGAITYA